jgi:hypothetical protein
MSWSYHIMCFGFDMFVKSTLPHSLGCAKGTWSFHRAFQERMHISMCMPKAWQLACLGLGILSSIKASRFGWHQIQHVEAWHTAKHNCIWIWLVPDSAYSGLDTLPSPHSRHAPSIGRAQRRRVIMIIRPVKKRFITNHAFISSCIVHAFSNGLSYWKKNKPLCLFN